jgi:hypothetical protein
MTSTLSRQPQLANYYNSKQAGRTPWGGSPANTPRQPTRHSGADSVRDSNLPGCWYSYASDGGVSWL